MQLASCTHQPLKANDQAVDGIWFHMLEELHQMGMESCQHLRPYSGAARGDLDMYLAVIRFAAPSPYELLSLQTIYCAHHRRRVQIKPCREGADRAGTMAAGICSSFGMQSLQQAQDLKLGLAQIGDSLSPLKVLAPDAAQLPYELDQAAGLCINRYVPCGMHDTLQAASAPAIWPCPWSPSGPAGERPDIL